MRFRSSAAVVGAALLFHGCSDPSGPVDSDPIDQLPRTLTVAEQSVIAGSNAFGWDLLSAVVADDSRPNVVLSPVSASMALGMALNGARGGTFDAMSATLGFEGLDQDEVNASYRGLLELLAELDLNVRFDIANAIWANEDIAFRDAFFDAVDQHFDADVASRDFGVPATLVEINDWVDAQTDGFIDRILEDLDPDLAMLLVNAIYFEGAWTTRFDPADTQPGPFNRPDGTAVTVPMMRLTDAEVALGGGDGFQVAELPYGGGAFAMDVVLPEGDIRDFVADLDPSRWSDIVESLGEPREIDLISIPKLRLSYDAWLNDALRGLGMEVAFTRDADFTGMTEQIDLCLDFVRQKTFLEVDEAGTKAAAVTAVGVRPTSFSGFVADRPFLLVIRERFSGTLLFVGIVGDPSQQEAGDAEPQAGCL